MELLPSAPDRFLNRELSWLAFNARVMAEAQREDNPLLERVRFLAIAAANLAEFVSVRVAGLKAQVRAGYDHPSPDGLSPKAQLGQIDQALAALAADQVAVWRDLQKKLPPMGLEISDGSDLSPSERVWLQAQVERELLPVLSPISVDPTHPFPFIRNQSYALALDLRRTADRRDLIGLLLVPDGLQKFIKLPTQSDGKLRFIHVYETILRHINLIFPGFEVQDAGAFQVVRDGDLEIEEEADDLVRSFESALKRRQRGRVVQLTVDSNLGAGLRTFLAEQFELEDQTVTVAGDMVDFTQLFEIVRSDLPEQKFAPFHPRFPERVRDFEGDCFAAIKAKDFVVHHPFESFDVVVQFLAQASRDSEVLSIKQTLYRTSNNSPIVRALCDAAERGKSVTALVELKARFDEAANLRWARDLERAGVQVVFGFHDLKTHAKISLVARREVDGGIKTFAHFGTGNYHPMTAKVYTDLSFFTADDTLCRDAGRLFNYMTSYAVPTQLKALAAAPLNLRETLAACIDREIANAQAGQPACIWIKMNALVDAEMIDHLYHASQAGVPIKALVRGICCLRPGVPGLSDRIEVRSLVGRFLEHSRIFCFGNGAKLPSREAKVFISSADWMPRNLNGRVETLVPIINATVHAQILDQVMAASVRDTTNTWLLRADGTYVRAEKRSKQFSAHTYFMKNPSLSGRGSALKKKSRRSFDPRSA